MVISYPACITGTTPGIDLAGETGRGAATAVAAVATRGRSLVGVPEPGVPDPAPGPRDASGGEIDPELIDLATKIFNLARAGDTAVVAAYVDAGVPMNMTDDKGGTLVMLAAYHGHAATVAALLERGADPGRPNDRGTDAAGGRGVQEGAGDRPAAAGRGRRPRAGKPSAADTAAMFGNEDFLAWFGGR